MKTPKKRNAEIPKRTLLDPEKAVTIRLEIVEKNKKFHNKKYCTLTPKESSSEADIKAETPDQPESLPTSANSTSEADLNPTAPKQPVPNDYASNQFPPESEKLPPLPGNENPVQWAMDSKP